MPKDVWDDSNAVQSNWVKFNVPQEDKVFGTLIDKRQVKSTLPGKEGTLTWVYEMKMEHGSFHALDEVKKVVPEPIVIEAGEIFSIGGTNVIDRQMKNIKLGQKIGLKFIEEKPSKTKGFAPAKIVKVFAPKDETGAPEMDKEWLAEQEKDGGFGAF